MNNEPTLKRIVLFLIQIELNVYATQEKLEGVGLSMNEILDNVVTTKDFGNPEKLISEIIGVNDEIVFHAINDNKAQSPEVILEVILHNKKYYNF